MYQNCNNQAYGKEGQPSLSPNTEGESPVPCGAHHESPLSPAPKPHAALLAPASPLTAHALLSAGKALPYGFVYPSKESSKAALPGRAGLGRAGAGRTASARASIAACGLPALPGLPIPHASAGLWKKSNRTSDIREKQQN